MIVDKLNTGLRRKVPHIYQAEMAECGHACLAMIAGYHGQHLTMTQMRNRHAPSGKGSTMAELLRVADVMGMSGRPVKMEMEHFKELKLPAILHWDFAHFVVATAVDETHLSINDPALGERRLPWSEVSKHFTGVALELTPTDKFTSEPRRKGLTLGQLIGRVRGLSTAGSQVLVAALLLEVLGLTLPYMSQLVTDRVVANADASLLTVLGMGFLLLVLMRAGLTWARDWAMALLSVGVRAQVAEKVLRHTLKLPAQFFERRRASDLANRFASLHDIERTLATTFLQTLLDSVFATLIVVVLFLYSFKLGALVLGASLAYAGVRWALHDPTRQAQLNHVEHKSRQDSSLLESLRAVIPIQLADKTTWRLAQWQSHLADATNAQIAQTRLDVMGRTANVLIFGLLAVLFLWVGASEVLAGSMTLGALFAALAYQQGAVLRLATLIDSVAQFKLLAVQLTRLEDIVYAPARQEQPASPAALDTSEATDASPPAQPLGFELRNVSYRYSAGESKVLDGVSLSIEPGQNVSLIGLSGCGKSTLLKLLTGLVEPTEGEVLVNGVPLSRFGVDRLRSQLSVVLQEDTLFYGTVADNISYFDPSGDMKPVAAAAKAAGLFDDIVKMPMQFQSLCGEGGSMLSGGQKQRLLLARALYRQPRALLLDEATSHLDIGAESKVNAALKNLAVTRLSIAHRPETVLSAERAVLLHQGKVAFDGSPEDALHALAGVNPKPTN